MQMSQFGLKGAIDDAFNCMHLDVHGREKVPTGGQVAVPAGGR
jgi:hypothetical protein